MQFYIVFLYHPIFESSVRTIYLHETIYISAMVIFISSNEDKMTCSLAAEYVYKKREANWWENHKKLSFTMSLT
jgi:hypothetical protein